MSQLPIRQNALIRVADIVYKLIGLALLTTLVACGGSPPANLGVHDGRLAPCPPSPNCVSSQNNDEHRIEPLPLRGSPAETQAHLLAILAEQPRVEVVAQQGDYLRAEFTSKVLRFVDDVEFLIGPEAVHVRSASRLGYSDLGVNRKRIEMLRQKLLAPR